MESEPETIQNRIWDEAKDFAEKRGIDNPERFYNEIRGWED